MIKLRNFSYNYDQRSVLCDVDLDIPSGKIVAVVGRNGSGKSTLAEVLSGLRLDFTGEVWLDDLKLTRHTPILEIHRKASLVLQNPDNQILFQKVYDDLAFVLDNLKIPTGEQDELIRKALNAVDMLDFMQANPHELSGGQKQRIVVASAILTQPKYLILDEATAMLDSGGKRAIYNLLQKFKKAKVTVLLMTNWLDEIAIADEVLILDQQKVFVYSRAELLADLSLFEKHGLEIPLMLKLLGSPEGKKFLC